MSLKIEIENPLGFTQENETAIYQLRWDSKVALHMSEHSISFRMKADGKAEMIHIALSDRAPAICKMEVTQSGS